MTDLQEIKRKYPDYKYLGWVNSNSEAYGAYLKSKDKEHFNTGRCLHAYVLHDLKAIVEMDSGD